VAAPTRVLVLSVDPMMARLLEMNLVRRGLEVQAQSCAACCGLGETSRPYAADVLIADLHCPAPVCWDAGPRLRAAFPRLPLLLLAHERPSAAYLQAHLPCQCLQKPFGMADAVRALEALIRPRA